MNISLSATGRVNGFAAAGNEPLVFPVEGMTENNCFDYIYLDGEYVYDPLNIEEETESSEDKIALLQAQLTSMTEMMDFYEDCITELAEIVYA